MYVRQNGTLKRVSTRSEIVDRNATANAWFASIIRSAQAERSSRKEH